MEIKAINNSIAESSTFNRIFIDSADPRTSEWFLMNNPLPLLGILSTYYLFVSKVGPAFMKNRKPYKLKFLIIGYNLIQIFSNCFMFSMAVSLWSGYNWNCQPVNSSKSPNGLREAWGCYLYFLNKISDLFDTVFFVLRKKQKQLSFLHLFHHTIMPIASWIIVKYTPGGHITFVGLLNTFVHIILYGYYFLAALGPEIQKYLWWKKYITKLQLIQFCLVFLHNMQLLFFNCEYQRWTILLTLPNAVFFYYLFNEFYKKSYNKKVEHSKMKNDLKSR